MPYCPICKKDSDIVCRHYTHLKKANIIVADETVVLDVDEVKADAPDDTNTTEIDFTDDSQEDN